MKSLVTLGILLLLFISSLSAQVKSWTDEKGVTHYENDPGARDIKRSEDLHRLREESKEIVESAMQKGIIVRVEKPSEIPVVYVGPTFYSLALDIRRGILDSVWLQYYAQQGIVRGRDPIIVEVFDAR